MMARKKRPVPKLCPFCGFKPTVEPWHGGPKTKRMVHCEADICFVNPSVTGSNEAEAVGKWNERSYVEVE